MKQKPKSAAERADMAARRIENAAMSLIQAAAEVVSDASSGDQRAYRRANLLRAAREYANAVRNHYRHPRGGK
jgi:predicted metal-dependent hydrolase